MMLKRIIFTLSFVTSFSLFAQEISKISQTHFDLPDYGSKDSVVPLEVFPLFIRNKSEQILDLFASDFKDSIRFLTGKIYDLESMYSEKYFEDSSNIEFYEKRLLIPKYKLIFVLTSREVFIEQLFIALSFDVYGQLIEETLPSFRFDRKHLLSLSEIQKRKNEFESDKMNTSFRFEGVEVKFDYVSQNYLCCLDYNCSPNKSNGSISQICSSRLSIPLFRD
jgi:hypothetical protein